MSSLVIYDNVYIDPGNFAGWAASTRDFHFEACGLARIKKGFAGLPKARYNVYAETPVIYPHSKQKARPKNIIKLASVMGELTTMARLDSTVRVQVYEPGQWKGQVPKEIMADRIIDVLSATELSKVLECLRSVPDSYQHNVIDAVGLWLFTAGTL